MDKSKYCSTCKQSKKKSEFNKNKAKKDGLNTICRECSNIRSRQYYSEHPEKHRKAVHARTKVLKVEIKEWVNSIRALGCTLCSEKDACCIDFHHTDPSTKDDSVAMIARKLNKKKIQKEIDKCVRVCSNCHRKIHAGKLKVG